MLLYWSDSWTKVSFRTCRHLKQPPWSSGSWDKSTLTILVLFKSFLWDFFPINFFNLGSSILTLGGLLGLFPWPLNIKDYISRLFWVLLVHPHQFHDPIEQDMWWLTPHGFLFCVHIWSTGSIHLSFALINFGRPGQFQQNSSLHSLALLQKQLVSLSLSSRNSKFSVPFDFHSYESLT